MSSSSDDEQLSSESLNEEILQFVNKCGPWVTCTFTLIQTNQSFTIQIILEENTLSKGYLYITKNETESESGFPTEWALFPISRLILLHFDENRIRLTFDDHDGVSLLFLNDPSNYKNRHLEVFISQFRICASLSKISIEDEKVRANNEEFLTKNATLSDFPSQMYDAFSIPSAASPIIFDSLGARETWSKRNIELNASYFTRPVDLKICCLTWNVGGGGNPNSDPKVLEDLRIIASEYHDIYFLTFQEIDMSFGAIVGGSSPMADEWTQCIRKAFNITTVSKKKKSRPSKEKRKKSKGSSKNQFEIAETPTSYDDSLYTDLLHSKHPLYDDAPRKPSNVRDSYMMRSGSFSSMADLFALDLPLQSKLQGNDSRRLYQPKKLIFVDNFVNDTKQNKTGDSLDIYSKNSEDDDSDSFSDPFVIRDDIKSAPNLIDRQSNQDSIDLEDQKPVSLSKPLMPPNAFERQYEMQHALSLGGVYAAIVVRKSLPISVHFDSPKKFRLGMHGMTANKSAIAYRSKIGDFTRINFVGCHLSAHQSNTEARNEELRSLFRNNATTITVTNADHKRSVEKVDFLVLEGDLNYRIDLDYPTCLRHIQNHNLKELLSKDQLNKVKKRDIELGQFDESPISFLPTYKFDKRSDIYDTSQKQRIPSYTDRVLVVTNNESSSSNQKDVKDSDRTFVFETDIIHDLFPNAPGLQSGQRYSSEIPPVEFPKKPDFTYYDRIENQFSDHRPVQCVLAFQIPKIIKEKQQEFDNVQTRRLEEMSAVATPKLEPKSCQFVIGLKKSVTFELKNVSCAWANWHIFIQPCELSDENEISISPMSGIIFPMQTVKITLTGLKKTKKKVPHKKKATKYSRNIIIESIDDLPLAFIEASVSNKT